MARAHLPGLQTIFVEASMRKEVVTAILLLALGAPATVATANAQAKSDQQPTFAAVYDHLLTAMEKEVVSAADAMPEDKFNFAPATTQGEFKGVRTFSEQIKHIAGANYMFGAAILGEKPPAAAGGENGPSNLNSKADVVKYLNDSYSYLHKALNSIDEKNVLGQVQSPFGPNKMTRLSLATIAISHPFDHYGQMVEYLRMNGIVPPASRGQ
jgi:uncharacterized damage-inducible protein DinB